MLALYAASQSGSAARERSTGIELRKNVVGGPDRFGFARCAQGRRLSYEKAWDVFAFDEIHGFEHSDVNGRQILRTSRVLGRSSHAHCNRVPIRYRVAAGRGERQQKHERAPDVHRTFPSLPDSSIHIRLLFEIRPNPGSGKRFCCDQDSELRSVWRVAVFFLCGALHRFRVN
jgi:hypothetical protein